MKVLTALCILLLVGTILVAIGALYSASVETESLDFSLGSDQEIILAHVSDLHFPHSFLPADDLVTLLSAQNPDALLLTGDIFDGEATKEEIHAAATLLRALRALCPCYMVIGNHEIGSEYLDDIRSVLTACDVCLLQNETVTTTVKRTKIAFIGLSDGYLYTRETLSSLPVGDEDVKILLSHRPEKFSAYAGTPTDIRPDLVFAGHAHGGIARLGKLSLYAPNQGLFPRYASGAYTQNGVTMIVSRGLGISGTDVRIYNKYHLPVAHLKNTSVSR